MSTEQERFEEKVAPSNGSGCKIWIGATGANGYGRFRVKGNVLMAHRFAYELYRGPIPIGLTIDHLCRVKYCVNPDHMEPVSIKDNILRGFSPAAINARKTHCKLGHLLVCVALRGSRDCRICTKARNLARNSKREPNHVN